MFRAHSVQFPPLQDYLNNYIFPRDLECQKDYEEECKSVDELNAIKK